MRSSAIVLVAATLLSAAPGSRANGLHDQLLRHSLALEQAAEGRLAERQAHDAVEATSTLLAPLRDPPAGFDPLLAAKVHRVREFADLVRAQRATGRTPTPPALPAPRTLHGADAPGMSCANALSLHEGEALRLPVSAGAQVWLRVAARGDAPVSLTTRGSSVDPALTAYLDCRVADREPLARADDSHGLQAELALLPRRQTFWYVRADNLAGAGDLVLSAVRAVAITGRVTRASNGSALGGLRVALFRNEGGTYFVTTSTITESNGDYVLANGGSGTFAVRTGDDFNAALGAVHQSYDRLTCVSPYVFDLATCGTAGNTATPIVLDDPETRTIDFALAVGGSVAGTLTSNLGGPVPGATVRLVLANGSELRSTTSDALGRWRIDGVPSTGFYLIAGAVDHAVTLHQGIECPGSQAFNCNLPAGTLVSVPNDTVVRVDMTLRRQQFVEVTFTVDGAPLPPGSGLPVLSTALLNSNGAAVTQGAQVFGSRYRLGPIGPGSYRLRALSDFAYPRLYPAVECASDCIAELGSGGLITVAPTDTVVSLDMDLRGYPSIQGTVTTEGSGTPIANATVSLIRAGGTGFEGYGTATGGSGSYRFDAVAPGSYLLRFVSNLHVDEVHDDVPCVSSNPLVDCPGATLVTVGSTTPDRTIDAALARSATISGRVASGGLPLTAFGSLSLVLPDGRIATNLAASSDAQGRYTVTDVPPGTWRVAYLTDFSGSYYAQIFRGVDCAVSGGATSFAGCPLAQATPVDVVGSAGLTGIDFDVRRNGSAAVRVLYAFDDAPLPGVSIDVWNAAGQRVDSRVTGADGRAYPTNIVGFTPAPHALSTDNTAGYINEVYQDIDCPTGSVFFGSCALTGYTPVQLPAPVGSPEIIWRIARPVPIFGGNFEP